MEKDGRPWECDRISCGDIEWGDGKSPSQLAHSLNKLLADVPPLVRNVLLQDAVEHVVNLLFDEDFECVGKFLSCAVL